MMYYNGDDNTGPVKVFCEIGDYGAATSGFGAINAALYYREKRTGLVEYVDISLVKTLASMAVKLDDQRIYHRETKKDRQSGFQPALPLRHLQMSRWQSTSSLPCSNNSLTFRFFRLIGRPELCEDPLASNMKRLENTEILMPVLYEWLEKMGTAANAEKSAAVCRAALLQSIHL